jgi:hypothetical protein
MAWQSLNPDMSRLYPASMLCAYRCPMTDYAPHLRSMPRIAATASLLVLGVSLCAMLGGCADLGDSFASAAFVDPAKYDLYDCKQLEFERRALAIRTAELRGLMTKAESGVAGSVVGELAYRNDYISARASAKLAEEMWQRGKCVATSPAVTPPAAPPPAPTAPADGKGRGSARSGSAVY